MKYVTDPCAQSALVARGPSTDRAIVRSRPVRRGDANLALLAAARSGALEPGSDRRAFWFAAAYALTLAFVLYAGAMLDQGVTW